MKCSCAPLVVVSEPPLGHDNSAGTVFDADRNHCAPAVARLSAIGVELASISARFQWYLQCLAVFF